MYLYPYLYVSMLKYPDRNKLQALKTITLYEWADLIICSNSNCNFFSRSKVTIMSIAGHPFSSQTADENSHTDTFQDSRVLECLVKTPIVLTYNENYRFQMKRYDYPDNSHKYKPDHA